MLTKKSPGLFLLNEASYESMYGQELARDFSSRIELSSTILTTENWESHPDLLGKAEIVLGGWGMPPLNRAFLDQARSLKAVFYAGGSVKDIATSVFWESGITLVSGRVLNAIPVAEYTLAMIILGLKHLWRFAFEVQRTGRPLQRDDAMPGSYRSTVGLVSLGAAGRRTAELLRAAMEVKIIAYDPYCLPGDAQTLGVSLVSLDELFRTADVVSLHAPLLPETTGLITHEHLSSMRPGATLINTARGGIICQDDLVRVLSARSDLTAILDVLATEPLPLGSPLSRLPNAVLTPHIAGSIGRECRRLGRGMLEELDRFLAGQPLRWQVTSEESSHSA